MREPADSQGSISPMFETAIALEEAREGSLAPKGSYPNVDCHSGILYRETGIPPDQFTSLFASQVRPVGWCTGESRFLKTVSSVRHGCIRDTNRANMSRLRNANNRYRVSVFSGSNSFDHHRRPNEFGPASVRSLCRKLLYSMTVNIAK